MRQAAGLTMAHKREEDGTDDLVRLYLSGIGQHPLLDKSDETRLAKAIEAGREAAALERASPELSRGKRNHLRRLIAEGKDAHRVFVQSNLRLVVAIAKRYQGSGLPLLDLVQEGNLGLIHAVDKFDWRKGFKFSTYATWWIRQAITRGIANTARTIRLPVHAGDKLMKIAKARSTLEIKFGRRPTMDEIASEVMISRDELVEAMRWRGEPLSLSDPLSENSDTCLGDVVLDDATAPSPFEQAAASMLPGEVRRLLTPLDDREAAIVSLRFGLDRGEPRTLEEVGTYFSLTRERIRQIEAKAMSKLRHPSVHNGAEDLLDG
jgi:RNA polymerase sigma factor (sigma-70 family)